jgi:hypothetical protein
MEAVSLSLTSLLADAQPIEPPKIFHRIRNAAFMPDCSTRGTTWGETRCRDGWGWCQFSYWLARRLRLGKVRTI